MVNNTVKKFIKIILPIIFINYFICISFFTHSHVINGVTIVHSHPYQKNTDGTASHEHSGAEIQLIYTLSTFFATSVITLCILLELFLTPKRILHVWVNIAPTLPQIQGTSRLRPPPAL